MPGGTGWGAWADRCHFGRLQAATGADHRRLGRLPRRPLADPAISRQSEFAADRFAADHGLALELAAALHAMDDGRRGACGWSWRLLASHPTSERRIGALLAATGSASSSARLRPEPAS